MKVTVKYFASLREARGQSEDALKLEPGTSLADLYTQLAREYAFPLTFEHVRVACNDAFVAPDASLRDGDVLAFIPPVAGG